MRALARPGEVGEQLAQALRSAPRRPRRRRTRPPSRASTTTSAVVRAPTSAMISASSRRSHVASSSVPSNSVAWISAPSACARLGQVLAQAAEEPAALLGLGLGGDRARRAPSPVMKRSVQSRGIAVRDDSARAALRTGPRRRGRPRADLIAAMVAEMAHAVRAASTCPGMPSATPADFAPPRGTFLVGFDDGRRARLRGRRQAPRRRRGGDQAHVRRARGARPRATRGCCCARSRTPRATSATASPGSTPARASRTRRRCTSRPATGPIGNFNANPVASYWGEKRLGAA